MLISCIRPGFSQVASGVELYHIYELGFSGSYYSAEDNPVRDIILLTTWIHENDSLIYKVYGFYDGDGEGGAAGRRFKVRFCPVKTGKWILSDVMSNDPKLTDQHAGLEIECVPSTFPGFWYPDPDCGGRWYRRSDGSHPYITGNTMYSFLSEHFRGESTDGHIEQDVINNAKYFNKLRFSITGDIYPDPVLKPFLDQSGNPTDDGEYSHRPNPEWFEKRVDLAVRTAFGQDMIADLILAGPDSRQSRSILQAADNSGDVSPFLRYIAARYGSYPNVWICIANEYDIKDPAYTAGRIVEIGKKLRELLPYSTPVSVHANPNDWNSELNVSPAWNDHIILQNKLKSMPVTASFIEKNYWIGGADKPVIDDELAYEGAGDGWSEDDVLNAFLGAFVGGGYGTTGYKPVRKQGHYFYGNFKAEEHHAADNLLWFRNEIDKNIRFRKMQPGSYINNNCLSIFSNINLDMRVLEWPGHEYILAAVQPATDVIARLPEGWWSITMYTLGTMQANVLKSDASGSFTFNIPSSFTGFYHFKRNDP